MTLRLNNGSFENVTHFKYLAKIISENCTHEELNSILRMSFSGMLRREALVRTDVSEERSASIIRMTRIARYEQR
jgi:hypothetical protein